MANGSQVPWIHLGECPMCVNGLVRVRCCECPEGSVHCYAICDECEAMWLEPSTSSEARFPKARDPLCPICQAPLFGPQSRWALPDDLGRTEWAEQAIFDLPLDSIPGSAEVRLIDSPQEEEFLTTDDIVDTLDAPPLPEATEPSADSLSSESNTGTNDIAYGQDEPRPGC